MQINEFENAVETECNSDFNLKTQTQYDN